MVSGRFSSEYRLVMNVLIGCGLGAMVGVAIAFGLSAWAGVVMALGSGLVAAIQVIGYSLARSKLKGQEAMVEPMRAAVRPTSRTV